MADLLSHIITTHATLAIEISSKTSWWSSDLPHGAQEVFSGTAGSLSVPGAMCVVCRVVNQLVVTGRRRERFCDRASARWVEPSLWKAVVGFINSYSCSST
jgi:hypothetical protein